MPKKKKAEVIGTVEAPKTDDNLSGEVVKNGFIGELEDTEIYKPGEPLMKGKKTSFDVYNADGVLLRTYTTEIHGENAEALANEFAAHTGGIVK